MSLSALAFRLRADLRRVLNVFNNNSLNDEKVEKNDPGLRSGVPKSI